MMGSRHHSLELVRWTQERQMMGSRHCNSVRSTQVLQGMMEIHLHRLVHLMQVLPQTTARRRIVVQLQRALPE
jgi:hypothetical protein